MSAVSVEYVGGPLDGRLQCIQADDEDVPPPELYVLTSPADLTLTYERHPSPRPHGPLWLYILKGFDL